MNLVLLLESMARFCCNKVARDAAIASYWTRKLLLVSLLKSVPRFLAV